MAAYCVRGDLSAYGISADAIASVPASDQDKSITAASALIDSYLRAQVTLPLSTWGPEMTRAASIIAAYDLMSARGYNPGVDPSDDPLRRRYEDVLAWLRMIATGTISPGVVDASPGVSSAAGSVLSNPSRGWQATRINGVSYGGAFSGGGR